MFNQDRKDHSLSIKFNIKEKRIEYACYLS